MINPTIHNSANARLACVTLLGRAGWTNHGAGIAQMARADQRIGERRKM